MALQQGQVQELAHRLGHESGEGRQRGVPDAGLTHQTAARKRNGFHWTLEVGRETQRHGEGVKEREREES